jgi:hypothetical protein
MSMDGSHVLQTMAVANTLTYCDIATVMAVKSFIEQAPAGDEWGIGFEPSFSGSVVESSTTVLPPFERRF